MQDLQGASQPPLRCLHELLQNSMAALKGTGVGLWKCLTMLLLLAALMASRLLSVAAHTPSCSRLTPRVVGKVLWCPCLACLLVATAASICFRTRLVACTLLLTACSSTHGMNGMAEATASLASQCLLLPTLLLACW